MRHHHRPDGEKGGEFSPKSHRGVPMCLHRWHSMLPCPVLGHIWPYRTEPGGDLFDRDCVILTTTPQDGRPRIPRGCVSSGSGVPHAPAHWSDSAGGRAQAAPPVRRMREGFVESEPLCVTQILERKAKLNAWPLWGDINDPAGRRCGLRISGSGPVTIPTPPRPL